MLHLMILLPILAAFFVPFIYKSVTPKIHTGWFVFFVPLAIFIYLLLLIPDVSSGGTYLKELAWIPSAGINFDVYLDGLSVIFGLLITGVGALVIIYSIYYLSKEREALHNFYVYLLLFMGAMLGVVFSDNVLVLYVFWEMTSISSFLLIAYWYQRKKSRYGAQKSMLITILGGLCMLAGFLLLSSAADTFSIRELISQASSIKESSVFLPAMILILIGAFAKSAQFPFSIWLPDAMEAPTPISAYLHSATMVKAGIYLVARLTALFGGTPEWFWIVSGVGLFTLFYGSLNAVKQRDLKGLLAYSTISQLGLIMSLFGFGSAAVYNGEGTDASLYAVAIFAAIFHMVNHSAFKGSLFMVVGIIDHETGTRDIRRLSGLMTVMPVSFTLAVIGSFAMAGLPPFSGFLSKEMFFTAALNASDMTFFGMGRLGVLIPAVAWAASVFTFIYCMILVFKTFTGPYKPEKLEKEAHEAPFGMLISPIILASAVILVFFFPNVLGKYIIQPALTAVLPSLAGAGGIDIKVSAWHGFNTELGMTVSLIAIGLFMYMFLKKWINLYLLYPQALTLNNAYNSAIDKLENRSAAFTSRYMTGNMQDYIAYIFVFMIAGVGGTLAVQHGFVFDPSNDAPVSVYEGGIIGGMLIGALAVLFTRSRVTGIIAIGGVGYLVTMLFVLFGAPDLALTQLVVETVTVTLFVLCFNHLPELRKDVQKRSRKAVNIMISACVGIVVTCMALAANGHRLFEPISSFYMDAYKLAGAKNIVNAILVDFRGFDTMLEVLVLCCAGLGVYTLIKVRLSGRNE